MFDGFNTLSTVSGTDSENVFGSNKIACVMVVPVKQMLGISILAVLAALYLPLWCVHSSTLRYGHKEWLLKLETL